MDRYRLIVKLTLEQSFELRKYLAEHFCENTFTIILYDKIANDPNLIVEDYNKTEIIPFISNHRQSSDFEYHFLYNGEESPLKIISEIEDDYRIISYRIERYNT